MDFEIRKTRTGHGRKKLTREREAYFQRELDGRVRLRVRRR
ncbi:hypothetical protein QWM81_23745 [Streptomyces ficellus]|uniref:Uncharacterized protein n=1 Tax=Streptomyces ficellus TaxID=1977088 RepID=A0ABT7ZBX6_9ACTN|nr:hypothetical protein [Streptomyces ficellus]MDN3297003.1 hypothetical protein [Streptomyces ficellus]